MSLHKLYVRATSFAVGGKLFVALASLGVLWQINLIVGKDAFGYVMLAFSLNYILASAVATLFQTVMMFHVSRDHEASTLIHTEKVGAALTFSLLFGTLLCLLEMLLAPALAHAMNKPEAAIWFSSMAWMIPTFAANSTLTTWYRARQDIPTMVMYFEILPNIFRFLILVPLMAVNNPPEGFIAWAFPTSYAIPFLVLYLRKPVRLEFHIRNFSTWDLSYGVQNMLTQIVTKSLRNIVIFLIGFFSSAATVADYSLAMRLGQFIQIPKLALSQLQVPRIGWYLKKNDRQSLHKEFTSLTTLSLSCTLIGVIVFIIAVPFILQIFGEYRSALPVFYVLMVDSIILSGFGAVGGFISIAGYARAALLINILSLLILLMAVFIFVPLYGGVGAAIATVIGSLCAMSAMALSILKKEKISTQTFVNMLVMILSSTLIIALAFQITSNMVAICGLTIITSYSLLKAWPDFKEIFLKQDGHHAS